MSKGRHLKATNIAREIWRQYGMCEYPKCKNSKSSPQLQGAHIYGVGAYPRLRDDLRNGLSLCSVCHRMFTDNPIAFTDWIRTTKYKQYLKPLMDINNGPKPLKDWDERLDFLKDVRRAVISGEITVDEARAYEETYGKD